MSISLKSIIQDTYKHKSLGFGEAKKKTISIEAGNILASLYEHHKNGSLAPESVIFLQTSNSIGHIISILKKVDMIDLDNAIREELELIYSNSQTTNKKVTLNSIVHGIITDLGGVSKISEQNKPNILSKISNYILEARVYGDLDDDTNKVIKQPDHMDLLSHLIDQIVISGDIFESIKALYSNVLSREHDFLDEVARDHDITEIIKSVSISETRVHEKIEKMKSDFELMLKMVLKPQFVEVHKHLNLIGHNVHIIGQNLLESDSEDYDECTSDHCDFEPKSRKDLRVEDEIRQRINERNERLDRNERNERVDRNERNERIDRNERNNRNERNERNNRIDRLDRPRTLDERVHNELEDRSRGPMSQPTLSRETLMSREKRGTDTSVYTNRRR